jgi:tRNA-dihydrouridine synthase
VRNFWQELPTPFFILAPMEAVTDVVFRHVVRSAAAPDVYFTEFTNATGWVAAGDKAIGGRLIKTEDESPLVAQLWGSVPIAMEKLSIHCRVLGYDGIDINMGCPDASAVKSGGGAGMIRTPELASEMIAAAKASGLPVSVKTRLGYSRVDEWQDWLTHLLKQDIVNLTIHLRTKKEMSKVPAHFELISDIKKLRDEVAPQTLLTINGDILDRAQAEQLVKETGVDGVMIGRGVFANPFIFEAEPRLHTRTELLNLLRLQLDLHDEWDTPEHPRKFDPLKRFFKIYVRDFEGAAELRDRLMHSKSTAEVRSILAGI